MTAYEIISIFIGILALLMSYPALCGRSGIERYSICVIDRAVLGLPFTMNDLLMYYRKFHIDML